MLFGKKKTRKLYEFEHLTFDECKDYRYFQRPSGKWEVQYNQPHCDQQTKHWYDYWESYMSTYDTEQGAIEAIQKLRDRENFQPEYKYVNK